MVSLFSASKATCSPDVLFEVNLERKVKKEFIYRYEGCQPLIIKKLNYQPTNMLNTLF